MGPVSIYKYFTDIGNTHHKDKTVCDHPISMPVRRDRYIGTGSWCLLYNLTRCVSYFALTVQAFSRMDRELFTLWGRAHYDVTVTEMFTVWGSHDICAHYWSFVRGIHRAPMESLHKGRVVWTFDVRPIKLLNKNSIDRWSETPWRSCCITVMTSWRNDAYASAN